MQTDKTIKGRRVTEREWEKSRVRGQNDRYCERDRQIQTAPELNTSKSIYTARWPANQAIQGNVLFYRPAHNSICPCFCCQVLQTPCLLKIHAPHKSHLPSLYLIRSFWPRPSLRNHRTQPWPNRITRHHRLTWGWNKRRGTRLKVLLPIPKIYQNMGTYQRRTARSSK